MPKLGKYYNVAITFGARDELREKLVTLSYLRGDGGEYAPIARDILIEAVDRYINDLNPHERKEFAEILKNVQAATLIDKIERDERLKERLKAKDVTS